MIGAPYNLPVFQSHVRAAYLNKPPSGAYRGVGQPIAVAVTEQLMDAAAAVIGIDPSDIRERNYISIQADSASSKFCFGEPTLMSCHTKLPGLMDYAGLRQKQSKLRSQGRYQGIGLSTFLEMTGVGSSLYGNNNVNVAAGEGCALSLEADGSVSFISSRRRTKARGRAKELLRLLQARWVLIRIECRGGPVIRETLFMVAVLGPRVGSLLAGRLRDNVPWL